LCFFCSHPQKTTQQIDFDEQGGFFVKKVTGLLLILLLALAGCGGTQTAPTEPQSEAPAEQSSDAATEDGETQTDSMDEGSEADTATEDGETQTDSMDEGSEADTAAQDGETADSTTTDEETGATPSENAITYTIVPEESTVSYAVDEVFLKEGNTLVTAIGKTQQIEGEVMFDPENPQNSMVGPITIDISAFKSDSDRRDKAIQDKWLESATYPIATFTPTEITGLPETYTDGEEVTLQITGDLTVRETTTPVTFETTGQITGEEMTGTATTTIQMTDFGFDPPDIAGVLKAENDAKITFDFVARAGEANGSS
jgi:polyisoprenoid-binding protein YceI